MEWNDRTVPLIAGLGANLMSKLKKISPIVQTQCRSFKETELMHAFQLTVVKQNALAQIYLLVKYCIYKVSYIKWILLTVNGRLQI